MRAKTEIEKGANKRKAKIDKKLTGLRFSPVRLWLLVSALSTENEQDTVKKDGESQSLFLHCESGTEMRASIPVICGGRE